MTEPHDSTHSDYIRRITSSALNTTHFECLRGLSRASGLRFETFPALQGRVDFRIDHGQSVLQLTHGICRPLIEGRIGQPALQDTLFGFQRGNALWQLLEFTLLLETGLLAFAGQVAVRR